MEGKIDDSKPVKEGGVRRMVGDDASEDETRPVVIEIDCINWVDVENGMKMSVLDGDVKMSVEKITSVVMGGKKVVSSTDDAAKLGSRVVVSWIEKLAVVFNGGTVVVSTIGVDMKVVRRLGENITLDKGVLGSIVVGNSRTLVSITKAIEEEVKGKRDKESTPTILVVMSGNVKVSSMVEVGLGTMELAGIVSNSEVDIGIRRETDLDEAVGSSDVKNIAVDSESKIVDKPGTGTVGDMLLVLI